MPPFEDTVTMNKRMERSKHEAYELGEQKGFEAGQQKALVLLDRLEGLITELSLLQGRIVKEGEAQCVALAVSIARKIMMKELTVHPDEIVEMTKEALMKLERSGQITIKVNPSLYDFFTKQKPELLKIHPDIVFDADPSVSGFGAVVMGPMEDVVTDLDEQIKNLLKDLGDHYARN